MVVGGPEGRKHINEVFMRPQQMIISCCVNILVILVVNSLESSLWGRKSVKESSQMSDCLLRSHTDCHVDRWYTCEGRQLLYLMYK